MTGAEILMESLLAEGIETIFGYPGGQILTVYDKMYGYSDRINHILVRHEQGAIHAAQGYARASDRLGVVVVTSGPGATNVITGIADAKIDSTPLLVICGQVGTAALGTDAFQETDLIGMAGPISKWAVQVSRAEDVAGTIAKAVHIATTGRPGPVVIDLTRDAQVESAAFEYKKCSHIRSYNPSPKVSQDSLDAAVSLIDAAQRPLLIFGQGIVLSGAEMQLMEFVEKTGIPAASTLLGLSAMPSDCPYYLGMLGMHGNLAPNIMTQKADLLIAVGMRFDDRVTGRTAEYAPNAKIIHIDIDATEIGKIIPAEVGIVGDAAKVLSELCAKVKSASHREWLLSAQNYMKVEQEKVCKPETEPQEGSINMGEVVARLSQVCGNDAVIVTDVGQNQMSAARYSRYVRSRSFISSGGLGTMGFGIPAAMGAKLAVPERQVCLFVGDGGMQMTIQELGTIMQEHIGVKIILLNNNWLGNVRQWQELFYGERYSQTRMLNPDYSLIAKAYGIGYQKVSERADLLPALEAMTSDNEPFILEVMVKEAGMVYPMVPPGKRVDEIMLTSEEWYNEN